jgi:hypothetical protein
MTNNYSIKIYESNHKIVINITYQENNNSIYSNKSEFRTWICPDLLKHIYNKFRNKNK